MSMLTQLRSLVRSVTGRASLEREMDQEFRSHIALRADDLERRGLSRAAAERAARIEFGSVEGYKDAARDSRGLAFGDELRSNAAFAWRGFRRRPLQAAIVVVTLTLGIGISAGVFSFLAAGRNSDSKANCDPNSRSGLVCTMPSSRSAVIPSIEPRVL